MTQLSRAELVARLGRSSLAQTRSIRLFFVVSAVGLLVLLLSSVFRVAGTPLVIAVGVWFLAVILILLRSPGERPKRYGLVCPVCDKTLGIRGAHIAIGTGRCMTCGQIIITGDAPGNPNADALSHALRAFARGTSALLVAAFVIPLVLPLVALLLINPHPQSGARNVILLLWLPGILGSVTLAGAWDRRRARLAGLVCNHCGELLTRMPPEIVAVSGRCGRCGQLLSVAA